MNSEKHLENLTAYNPYRDVPQLTATRLEEISEISRITSVSDFDPAGDSTGKSLRWSTISRAVLIRDNYSCRVCGQSELSNFSTADQYNKIHLAVQVHHIVPKKDGGKDTFRNLITLCEECHRKTFSNDYAGLPVTGQTTIYGFDMKFNLCVRKDWIRKNEVRPVDGKIRDYTRAFDTSMNSYRVIPQKNEAVPISVAEVSFSDYRELCEVAHSESGAVDYVTLLADTEMGKTKVRFFLNPDGDLIL